MKRELLRIAYCLLIIFVLVACSEQPDGETIVVDPGTPTAFPTPTEFVLPTLLPTFTRPVDQPSPTPLIRDTATPRPDVDFGEVVVDVRYNIPGLGLDRRIEGNVVGQVTVVDEATGLAAIRQNQGEVLISLQSVLPTLELSPVPAGCDLCVHIEYNLPVADSAGEGWLQDEILLASIENYTALNLGAHFPPDTVVGLRRNASAYHVAHTIAITADGQLWRWRATQDEVSDSVALDSVDASILTDLNTIPVNELSDSYLVDCLGSPIEMMYLAPSSSFLGPPLAVTAVPTATVTAEDQDATPTPIPTIEPPEPRNIRIICPAFSLPTTLVPLYLKLDSAVAETAAVNAISAPPPELPLDFWLDYRREDGAKLTVQMDGRVVAVDPAGEPYTSTLTLTKVMSITTILEESGDLIPGVANYAEATADNVLLLRWSGGVSEAIWAETAPPAVRTVLPTLDGWLDELTGLVLPEITITPTITATSTITP